MQSMIQSMTSVNRETQEVLIPQFSFSVRFIPHSIRIKCPRWKDIVWLTSGFKSQLSKAKFDKGSKSSQHSTLNASPRCIYPTQTCGENTLWGGRPERGKKIKCTLGGTWKDHIQNTNTTQTRVTLVMKTHCGEDARSGAPTCSTLPLWRAPDKVEPIGNFGAESDALLHCMWISQCHF